MAPAHLAGGLAFDMLALTTLLLLSGGPHNPFSFLYLVYIALAAVALPPRITWPLVSLAAVGAASLFVLPSHHLHIQQFTERILFLTLALGTGCTAVAQSGPLSSRPFEGNQVFLSTGASPRAYQTLGFVQATGFGNQVAGVVDVGDAQIDGTIKGALVNAAIKLGGDGIINIEFLDENPQTPADRAGDLADSLKVDKNGNREVKTRWRSVHANGEVIRFL